MKKFPIAMAFIAAGVLTSQAAFAQSSAKNWWLHTGPVLVKFNTDTKLIVGGAPLDGTNARAKDNPTLGLEIGYEVAPSTIVSLLVGVPPTTTLTAKGAPIDGVELGKAKYAPAVLSAHYHFDAGAVKPYIGAGVNYTIVLDSRDGAVANLDVKSAWGAVIQAGVDIPLHNDWFLFADLKKIYLKTTANGTVPAFGNPPAQAKVRLDPLLINVGVGWRF
ncbi:MAG TPA: OmpW family outer membrane protein [Methylibium sp.]|nr:OmpW family outer membrane protein [Methylibium sp.]